MTRTEYALHVVNSIDPLVLTSAIAAFAAIVCTVIACITLGTMSYYRTSANLAMMLADIASGKDVNSPVDPE